MWNRPWIFFHVHVSCFFFFFYFILLLLTLWRDREREKTIACNLIWFGRASVKLKNVWMGRETTHSLISDNEMRFDSTLIQTLDVSGWVGGGREGKGRSEKNRYLLRARHQKTSERARRRIIAIWLSINLMCTCEIGQTRQTSLNESFLAGGTS